MKKFWMIFLVMVMCLSLVACGGNEEVDSDSDGQLVSDAEVQEPANSEPEIENDGSDNNSPSVEAPEEVEDQTTDVEDAPSGSADLNDSIEVGENIPNDSSAKTDSEQYITEELTNPEQEALIASVAEILANGGHPYDFGYYAMATDTERRLSREEYDSWVALGYDPLVDDYFDSEHFAGLY